VTNLSAIFVLVFLAGSLATYGFYWVFIFNRREKQVINRRLELNRQLRNASVVLATLHEERGIRNVTNPALRRLSDWLTQTGTSVGRNNFVLSFLGVCAALMVAFSTALGLGVVSTLLAVVTTAGLALFYLIRKRNQRITSFGEQLPDAIDVIVRGVRAGLPFISAVALVAQEMPDPVGTEFGMFADEIEFGLDLRSALDSLYRRVGQADLLFLTISVGVQAQTGGNLAEILSRLSRLMRARANMRLKIRALSAEGRASAITLSAFPFVLYFLVDLISPTYYGAIWSNSIVEPAIYLGLLFLAVGNAIMYRMVHFKY
jgi:tight adherence protein B